MLGACPLAAFQRRLAVQSDDHSHNIEKKGERGGGGFEFWEICGLPKEFARE